MTKQVLSLGQCAADNYSLTRFLEKHFQTKVWPVDTFAEALDCLTNNPFDLILVNRILDQNGAEGLDFIQQIKNAPAWKNMPVMLVSNYPDAQQQAVALGALPGFGKAGLGEAQTIARLRGVFQKEPSE